MLTGEVVLCCISVFHLIMKTSLVACVLACCLWLGTNTNMRVEAGSKIRLVNGFFDMKRCCKRRGCPMEDGNCVPYVILGCICRDEIGLWKR